MATGSVREIASRAGVSPATVSRVINHAAGVKPDTVLKVQAVIKELGLLPEDIVRKGKSKDAIGILVTDIGNPFFTGIIKGVEEIADRNGYGYLICDTAEDEEKELHCLQMMKDNNVSGLIMTPVSDDDTTVDGKYLDLLNSLQVPIVLVDRDIKYSKYAGVFIDNVHGAFEAANLLLRAGHRNIAVVAGPGNTKPGRERLDGFKAAFTAYNIPFREELVYQGNFEIEGGYRSMEKILKSHPEVTAVFAGNNLMTLGCMSCLSDKGLKVPEDMAIVGFDDQPELNIAGVPITCVVRSEHQMGIMAMELLHKQICKDDSGIAQRIIIKPELKIRGSELLLRKA